MITATQQGQYRVVDLGEGADTELRYAWVETVAGSERTMCAFLLFSDALQMLPSFQTRETRERAGRAVIS